jgi:hypothetical protein
MEKNTLGCSGLFDSRYQAHNPSCHQTMQDHKFRLICFNADFSFTSMQHRYLITPITKPGLITPTMKKDVK